MDFEVQFRVYTYGAVAFSRRLSCSDAWVYATHGHLGGVVYMHIGGAVAQTRGRIRREMNLEHIIVEQCGSFTKISLTANLSKTCPVKP